ncbi:unnamed protein product [Triticum turgidum subsp. durum]|uniref:Ubiquitin-like protease family profile domain-containing protein n=1 Tax=Triticum turgidum subsp. durum TaxID=4567 RepID=A0A9R0ZC80_TRITD|nr:unnamed protein product [Triticum turgidum subsp. durum]
MGKPSGSDSKSNSDFRRAISAVRTKNRDQISGQKRLGGSRSKKRSSIKRKAWKDKLYSRCAPSIIVDLMEDLDEQPRKLVEEMGFQGLHSLKLHKLNKPLGAWLLSKFDTKLLVFFAGTSRELKMTPEDVNRVSGIPCSGMIIVPPSPQDVISMKAYFCGVFEKSSWDEITISFLLKIVTTKPKGEMTSEEILRFKTAFAFSVVTKFFAPQSLNNFISTRYMKAVFDMENIHAYNWAQFVADELRLAAASLQLKLSRGKNIGYINGCMLIPQIHYLDSLDFGKDSPPDHILPRFAAYNDAMVCNLIKRDIILKNRLPFPTYGKLKIRSPHSIRYESGPCVHAPPYTPVSGRVFNSLVNLETPKFDMGLSQLEPGDNTTVCNQVTRVTANLSAQFDMAAETTVVPDTPDQPQQAPQSDFPDPTPTSISPHSLLQETSAIRISIHEECGLPKVQPKTRRRIIGVPSDMLLDIPKRVIKPSRMVKSPFLCKQYQCVRLDVQAQEDLFTYTNSISVADQLRKIWLHISDPVPRFLKLQQIQEALAFDAEMQDDAFNVAVQALFEDEVHRFGGTDFLGWRHFLNQDFAMHATAGGADWNPEDHVYLFNDIHIPYDVSKSRLIYIPLHQPFHFSVYAFDMENEKIQIMDSLRDTSKGGQDIEARHSKTKNHIAKALQDCMVISFPDWKRNISSWQHEFPTNIPATANRIDTAFHVLHIMRNWDAKCLVNPVSSDSRDLRKVFLANLLSFTSNEAILPESVNYYIKALRRY